MTPKLTPEEEAETKMRALIAERNVRNEKIDVFIARIPKMRTSDLFGYIADGDVLANALGVAEIVENEELSEEDFTLVTFAAALALKDEIDRRFPIPVPGDSR